MVVYQSAARKGSVNYHYSDLTKAAVTYLGSALSRAVHMNLLTRLPVTSRECVGGEWNQTGHVTDYKLCYC